MIDTNLVLQSLNHNDYRNLSLYLSCTNSNASIRITLNISSCPHGFFYDSILNMCKCAIKTKHAQCVRQYSELFVCHMDTGMVK